jgi:Ca2+-binding RTX toxin-like protein
MILRPRVRPLLLLTLLAAALPAQALVTTTVDGTSVTVTSVDEVSVTLACGGGNLLVNGAVPPDAGTLPCNGITGLRLVGNALDNDLQASAVTPTDFTSLLTVDIEGLGGADTILGSGFADTIEGGDGNDTIDGRANPAGTTDSVFGGNDDDNLIWNPGGGDDLFDGEAGNDSAVVRGGGVAEVFQIAVDPGEPDVVIVERTAPAPFFVQIEPGTEILRVEGNGGDDTINAATLPNGLIALELFGGDGNDTITGGDGADLLDGGPGNDLLDGDDNPVGTTDTVMGGDGDDTMVWNPGKDDDVSIGGAGNDVALIVGGGVAEIFAIAPSPLDPAVVRLERTAPAPFFVDISETEILRVQGNGGDDTINAATLPAGMIALELFGGDGNDTITGGDGADLLDGGPGNDLLDGDDNPVGTTDTVLGGDGDDAMVWNPGKDDDVNIGGPGNDTSVINGGGGDEVFRVIPEGAGVRFERTNNAPAPFFVSISQTERLQVNAGGGNDSVDGSALTTGLIALEFNGGAGNDTLVGGPDADVLNGGDGNDTLQGGPNPLVDVDRMSGDGGDDLLLWNPGESSDLNEGGDGNDTLLVNGAGANERFEIEEVGGRLIVQRVLPTGFVLDNGGIENLQLNTVGGDDVVQTEVLSGIEQRLDGGTAASAAGDRLIVRGYAGRTDFSPILVPGAGAIVHTGFEAHEPVLGGGNFSARLEGAQEVPPVVSAASGRGSVVLNAREDEITVRLSFTGLGSDSTMAHIHGPALPGANAGVLFGLAGAGGTTGEIGPLSFAVTPTQVQQLKDGLWYFNVHSVDNGGGEIRGQILIDELFTAPVESRQVVPASLSTASGYATIVLAGTQDQATVTMQYAGLVGEGQPGVSTAVRVHAQAARGQVGPVVASFVLPASGSDEDSFIAGPFPMSAGQVNGLRNGGWYIEVESLEFPSGEIRGQFGQSLFFDNFE